MTDYIERQTARPDAFCEGVSCQECPFLIDPIIGGCKVDNYILSLPAADVRPVVRGKWIKNEGRCGWHCSNCKVDNILQTKVELSEVNTVELRTLKNEETLKLIEKARAGDKKAQDRAVCGNLKLVLAAVRRFSGRNESPYDLFQVGVIGLIKAVRNFDPSQKVRFSTYGMPMIIGEIRRYLRDSFTHSWNNDIGKNEFQDNFCPHCGADMRKEV